MRRLHIYISEKQYEILRLIAYKHITTLSTIIRWCIDDYSETKLYLKAGMFESRIPNITDDLELELFLQEQKNKKKEEK